VFSCRPRFINTDLRPESVVEPKHHMKLLTDGSLRERVGSIVVGDVAQHTCLVHGLEAVNRVSERLLEFNDYVTRSGVPRQKRPRLLRLGGERRAKEQRTRASQERATVYHWVFPQVVCESGARGYGAWGKRVGSMQKSSSVAVRESIRALRAGRLLPCVE